MGTLVVGFVDFKRLAKDHRIYYYEGDDYLDFHFVFDGGLVKSSINKSSIENLQQFISDPLFYGAVKLDFNIPYPETNLLTLKKDIKGGGLDIVKEQDKELKNIDIQKEGVNSGTTNS